MRARAHTHMHAHTRYSIEKHAQAHEHPFDLEDEQYLPCFLSFCSVNELFFNDFPCLETRAYDNISYVC